MQTFSNIDSRESELQIDDDSEVPVRYQEKSEYQELDDWENQQCLIATEEPKTYQEAINSKDSAEWVGAMTEEFNFLIDHNVWKIVDRPRGRQVLTGKWVFKSKINQNHVPMRFKARYVARGYTQ
ncbi:unnamed protein product [Rotaria socialis]|uniref:Reverse transcriptase Ty1/copia-type domain-containing protein n=1 Tax=Rotaria socialis TaxID=392032 RepID=A0A817WVS7_9BILA|nr:unnamed protein product [Rotaria socialis]CAF4916700.1 unnamed protein product [Rotaria socialis]